MDQEETIGQRGNESGASRDLEGQHSQPASRKVRVDVWWSSYWICCFPPNRYQDLAYIISILDVKLIASSGLFSKRFSLIWGGVAIVPNDAVRPSLPHRWSKETAFMELKGIEIIPRLYPELLSQVSYQSPDRG